MSEKHYKYPRMRQYLTILHRPNARKMVGREKEVKAVLATLNRDEVSNAMLLGPAGCGKTTLAYGVAQLDHKLDPNRVYFSVALPSMARGNGHTDGSVYMASEMTGLIHEIERFQKETGHQCVLFMDEVHLIAKISPAAIEALKPILANSGSWNIRIIAATTYLEYNEYIKSNEPLTERFERIDVPELTYDQTLETLKDFMHVHLPGEYVDEKLLREIINVTNRALPSQQQPRKSLRIIDFMSGFHKTFKEPMNIDLLAKVMSLSVGVNIKYQVDARDAENRMNHRVFDQTLAVRSVMDRIYISVAGLNDQTRPRGSFLFVGPTGVGKTELAKTMANVLFGSDDAMIRFDMTEFSRDDSVDTLQRMLTERVWEHPSSIILFDEIEKASSTCSRLLLQLLDDARMMDEHGQEVSFKDNYIICTTNAGADTFHDLQAMYGTSNGTSMTKIAKNSSEDLQALQRRMLKSYMPLIRRALMAKRAQFPAELLGRFDAIVPFAGIDENTRMKICKVQLGELAKTVYQKHNVVLHIDKDVYNFIVKEHLGSNETERGGGREVRRRIDENVVSKVAQVLIEYPGYRDLAVGIKGQLAYKKKNELEGSAEVVVGKWNGR